jgi:hypothetical protein
VGGGVVEAWAILPGINVSIARILTIRNRDLKNVFIRFSFQNARI